MQLKDIFLKVTRPWLRNQILHSSALSEDPFIEFDRWFSRAKKCLWIEYANSMSLSTIGGDGYPECRLVLLKGHDRNGFVFYTNLTSAKGISIQENNRVALTFYWEPLHRQIRIVGEAEPVTDIEADEYFASRPRGSQIGAWASDQSSPLESREVFEAKIKKYEAEFSNSNVPRPPHWSGFRVIPKSFEFWEMKASRLHDRFQYRKNQSSWKKERLYP